MVLVCKPRGRGNWTPILIEISKAPDLFAVHVGTLIHLGPWIFRVCAIKP